MNASSSGLTGEVEAFERRYAAPQLEADQTDAVVGREAREGQAVAEPAEAYALAGCVLTPDKLVDPGRVVVAGGVIVEVRDTSPATVRTVETANQPAALGLPRHARATDMPSFPATGHVGRLAVADEQLRRLHY